MKVFWIIIAGFLLLLGSGSSPAAAQPGLFISKGSQADQGALPRVGVIRGRTVDVDLSQMPGADGRGELPRAGHELVLNVFDDVVLQARMERSERTERGMRWVGKLKGKPTSDVVIVIHDGVMAGSIVSPEAAYSIRYNGSSQVVEEIDRSALPPEAEPLEPPSLPAPDAPLDPAALMDDGSNIDVLVVYTPAARNAAGGTSGIQSRIQLGVTETNAAYANSGVLQRLRLVGAVEVSYTESGDISTDLNRLTYTDGVLDNVQSLRDAYKADLVSLITSTPSPAYCGVAWLMGGNSPSFAPNAYSVVEQTCISPSYSFGHELGHNMGLNHARTDPVGTGAYSYSYGYKDPLSYFRTMMAYDCPISCPRILNFSNPNVFYNGRTTGIVETAADSAYNALSLNNTRVTVANFRVGEVPTVTVTSPNGGEYWPANSQQVISWTASGWNANAVARLYYTTNNWATRTFIGDLPQSYRSLLWLVPNTPGSSLAVSVCSYVGGACEVEDRSNGSFLITAAATPPKPFDLTGDGSPDLLWHNQSGGSLYAWAMQGLNEIAGYYLYPSYVADLQWQIRGVGDLNRDGKTDLLWHNQTTGDLFAWLMNGGLQRISETAPSPGRVSDVNWQIKALADFNADGNLDILWQHKLTGGLYVWIMSGLVQIASYYLTPGQVADTQWQVKAAADFDGDGKPDILWHHASTGALYLWTMNGLTQTGGYYLTPAQVPNTQWQIREVADFSGDGKPDILWYHESLGYLYVWTMNGTVQTGGYFLTPSRVADTRWQVVVR